MKRKILFFDDEKDIAEPMQKNLEVFDYDVTLVCTINEFYECIDDISVSYDLLLMDVMSPLPTEEIEISKFTQRELANMNNGLHVGEIIVEKLRSNTKSKYVDVPILFYSIRENVRVFEKSKHIRKPVLVKDLIEEIDNLLK